MTATLPTLTRLPVLNREGGGEKKSVMNVRPLAAESKGAYYNAHIRGKDR